MRNAALQVPGIAYGTYPQRLAPPADGLARIGRRLHARLLSLARPDAARYRRFAQDVRSAVAATSPASAEPRQPAIDALRLRLARDGLTDATLGDAFRLIDAVAASTLGVRLYDSQLIAARIMLDGRLAEMATGEGKTLAMALGAAAAALAGIPVHVITANQYLVGRDAAMLRPLYAALGLTVGAIEENQDTSARRREYACDITYATAKELGFDYLRDGIARGGLIGDLEDRVARLCASDAEAAVAHPAPVMRGLCMALIDEADSCLIDDAQVPLILARPAANAGRDNYYGHAISLARRMQTPRDYLLDGGAMHARLSAAGRAALELWAADLPAVWRNRGHREETLATALAALHLYRRDGHYLVQDGRVVLIDAATGRIAAGRAWSGGLQQLIEHKEGCQLTAENQTCAQITFQRLFRRYWRLGGMSGTLAEARGELRAIYDLAVVPVPLQHPSRRLIEATRMFGGREQQFEAVVAAVGRAVAAGRPVLIGTDSVADSHALAARLNQEGLRHQVLNALHEAEEAAIVAGAGAPGRITVATNMAGRGTDIALAAGVAERGGLALICCQHNASPRIDRQLIGRAARRGDPGSAVTLLCVKQPLIAPLFPRSLRARLPENGLRSPLWLVRFLVRLPQWRAERRARAARQAMLERDAAWDRKHPAGAAAE